MYTTHVLKVIASRNATTTMIGVGWLNSKATKAVNGTGLVAHLARTVKIHIKSIPMCLASTPLEGGIALIVKSIVIQRPKYCISVFVFLRTSQRKCELPDVKPRSSVGDWIQPKRGALLTGEFMIEILRISWILVREKHV
jgi:hypothetical protein